MAGNIKDRSAEFLLLGSSTALLTMDYSPKLGVARKQIIYGDGSALLLPVVKGYCAWIYPYKEALYVIWLGCTSFK